MALNKKIVFALKTLAVSYFVRHRAEKGSDFEFTFTSSYVHLLKYCFLKCRPNLGPRTRFLFCSPNVLAKRLCFIVAMFSYSIRGCVMFVVCFFLIDA